MWNFGRAPNNASKWQMGFNSVALSHLKAVRELTKLCFKIINLYISVIIILFYNAYCALRYWSDGPGIDPGGENGDFFRGSRRPNHVP